MTSLTSQPGRASAWPLRGPCRLATVATLWAVLVIAFGAMTTSTGSGLSIATWPLGESGELIPANAVNNPSVFLEYFHRVVAAGLGLLALALWFALLANRRATSRQRWLAFGAGLLVAAQAVLGGTGVLLKLPVWNSTAHGVLAQLTIASFAMFAYALSERCANTVPRPHPSASGVRRTIVAAFVLLLAQTVVGGLARHSGSLPALWLHVFNALAVFILLVITAGLSTGRLGEVAGVRAVSRVLMVFVVAQVILGVVALIVRTGVKDPKNVEQLFTCTLISAHVLLGALLTVTTAVLAAHVFRGAVPVAR